MSTLLQKMTTIGILIAFTIFLMPSESYAESLTVKIVIDSNKTEVRADSDPIALKAQVKHGTNLKYEWKLQGPGTLDGIGPAIFYIPPDRIRGKSEQAMVTVKVTDDTGQEATEAIIFNILPHHQAPVAPTQANLKGMSTRTKMAIGAVSAAALGGGIAVLAGQNGDDDGDDNDESIKNPFSGTFISEYGQYDPDTGKDYKYTFTLRLVQDENTITGNYRQHCEVYGCCVMEFTVDVTGTAEGNTGTITWGYGRSPHSCYCDGEVIYGNIDTEGGTYSVTLLNNGQILNVGDSSYIRQAE